MDMGFYVALSVQFYSMPLKDVLALPVRRFWFLVRQVERIEARRDLRQIEIMGCIHGEETLRVMVDYLTKLRDGEEETEERVSTPALDLEDENAMDPEFDRHALRALKARHG